MLAQESHEFIRVGVSILPLFYEVLLVGKWGGTPGKLLCGLRVVRDDCGKVSYTKAAARFLAKQLSNLTLGIGYLIIVFDYEKRALHDHICATRVIHYEP